MVKKISKSSGAAGSGGSPGAGGGAAHLAGSVKESAQQIWLAGMGAFAKAQEEGTKMFEALVKEGVSLQKKTQGIAEERISEVTGKMTALAETVQAKAGQNWDKLEALFEQRTAKAMAKLGVPTAKELSALSARVEELAAAVAGLQGAKVGKAAKAPENSGAKTPQRAAVKRAPRAKTKPA